MRLGYLALFDDDAKLPLNGLHLILEPQLEFLKPHLLQLFVFRQVAFLGE
jgi:hypothetical protein